MKDSETNSKTDLPVVYACSGCSDAGELADRIARRLAQAGDAEMSCLAGIGGRVKSLTRKAETAGRILVVDGCPLNCAAHTLKLSGFSTFEHLELQKLGLRKGSCPVTEERIRAGIQAAREVISRESPGIPADPMPSTLCLAISCYWNDKKWLAFAKHGQDRNHR
jgi:uncharacterized metal-binding protein